MCIKERENGLGLAEKRTGISCIKRAEVFNYFFSCKIRMREESKGFSVFCFFHLIDVSSERLKG